MYQRKSDGRWVGVLPAALSPTHRRQTVYGATRAAALAKLDALKAAARGGTLVAPNRLTVNGLLDEFLRAIQVSARSAGTYRTYETAARLYLRPHLGDLRVATLKPAHLTRAYAQLLTGGLSRRSRTRPAGAGLSPTTVAQAHNTLHLALEMAVRWRYVGRNVADDVEPPRPVVEEALALDVDAVRAFLTNAAARRDPYLAAWYVALDTGARRSEIVALRWDDLLLDTARPRLLIRRTLANRTTGPPVFSDTKTQRSRRPLTLAPITVAALAAHRTHQAARRAADPAWRDYGLIFPARHGDAYPGHLLYGAFKRAAAHAGLPATLRLHGLRHTMATLLLAGGADLDSVSRRLGHANSTITLGIYKHAVPSSEAHAAHVMARVLDAPALPAPDAPESAPEPAPDADSDGLATALATDAG